MSLVGKIPVGVNYITDTKPSENPFHFWANHKLYYEVLEQEINRNLDEWSLREELTFIKDKLHCNAIKIMGHSIPEAIKVAKASKEMDLIPWFCPRFVGATFDQTKEMLKQYCEVAVQGCLGDFPLVVANELPYDCASDPISGRFTSSDYEERGKLFVENYLKRSVEINSTQRVEELMKIARDAGWNGILTYAALPEEQVNWEKICDSNIVVGVNLYWGINHEIGKIWESKEYDARLKEIIKKSGKRKVVITEFGSVPQKEGLAGGGAGWNLDGPIDYKAQATAYEAYLKIFQVNSVGYFAYAFHETKGDFKEYGVNLTKYGLPELPSLLHKSFAIALRDRDNEIKTLTPAGEVLARYNLRVVS